MKRILALVSLILCMTLVLASCSLTAMNFKKLYKDYEYEAPTSYTTASQIADLSDTTEYEEAYDGDISTYIRAFLTSDLKTLKFYNTRTGAVVLTTELANTTAKIFDVLDIPFIKVTEIKTENEITTTYVRIYDQGGMLIADAKRNGAASVSHDVQADFFKFDGVLYKVNEDGTTTKLADNYFAYLPKLDGRTENFYYKVDYPEGGVPNVSVYDLDLNCVFYWEVSFKDYDDVDIHLVGDGAFIAQVTEKLPEDAKDYDYVDGGVKYKLTSYTLNAEKGKVKETKLDFVIDKVEVKDYSYYSYACNYESEYSEKVTNRTKIRYINDKKKDARDTDVILKPNGDVIEITPEFENIPSAWAENRWVETRDNGGRYLIDENGDIIGNVTGANGVNAAFIRAGEKLLDFDLELVYDAKANGKKIHTMLLTSVILVDETPDSSGNTSYYLYKADGTLTKIENYDTSSYRYYRTKDSTTSTYTYYSETGAVLLTVTGSHPSTVTTLYDENANNVGVIISIVDSEGKTQYYKIS